MPDTNGEGATIEATPEPAPELVRDEPVEVTAQVVPVSEADEDEDDAADAAGSTRGLAIRHVLERQLTAGHGLSTELLSAATDAGVAVAHAPAVVVNEIRGGATLPTALARAGETTREAVSEAGGRVRSAVGGYATAQATLPNAFVTGASEVAGSFVRAQGELTASALNSVYLVALATARGGDVREELRRERSELGQTAGEARAKIGAAVDRARTEVRSSVKDFDELAADLHEVAEELSEVFDD